MSITADRHDIVSFVQTSKTLILYDTMSQRLCDPLLLYACTSAMDRKKIQVQSPKCADLRTFPRTICFLGASACVLLAYADSVDTEDYLAVWISQAVSTTT